MSKFIGHTAERIARQMGRSPKWLNRIPGRARFVTIRKITSLRVFLIERRNEMANAVSRTTRRMVAWLRRIPEWIRGIPEWAHYVTSRKITSLYIDDTSIKLAVAKGRRIKTLAETRLEPGLVKDGIVALPTEVGAEIKTLFDVYKVKKNKVIVGMTGLHCLSRVTTMPWLSDRGLAEAIRRESERELPVAMDSLYLSWQVVERDGKEVKVFFVACERNVVDSLVETLKVAGIRPYLADVAPLTLTRVAGRGDAAVIDIRSNEFDIVVMANGIPEVARSLPLAAGMSGDQSLRFIREEVERTIDFHVASTPDRTPTELPIFVAGRLSGGEDPGGSLGTQMGKTVSQPLVPFRYPNGSIPSDYMVNLGLILKRSSLNGHSHASSINFNAFPQVYLPRKSTMFNMFAPPGAVAALMIIAATVLQIQNTNAHIGSLRSSTMQAEYIAGKRQVGQIALNKEMAGLKKGIDEATSIDKSLTAARQTIEAQQSVIFNDLQLVVGSAPLPITLTSVSDSARGVTVTGKATTETEVLNYARELMASGRFAQLVINGIVAQDEESVGFNLSLGKGK